MRFKKESLATILMRILVVLLSVLPVLSISACDLVENFQTVDERNEEEGGQRDIAPWSLTISGQKLRPEAGDIDEFSVSQTGAGDESESNVPVFRADMHTSVSPVGKKTIKTGDCYGVFDDPDDESIVSLYWWNLGSPEFEMDFYLSRSNGRYLTRAPYFTTPDPRNPNHEHLVAGFSDFDKEETFGSLDLEIISFSCDEDDKRGHIKGRFKAVVVDTSKAIGGRVPLAEYIAEFDADLIIDAIYY